MTSPSHHSTVAGLGPSSTHLMLNPGTDGLRSTIDRIRLAEEAGVDCMWLPQLPHHHDVGTVAAGFLAATRNVCVGTAVAPISNRHPVAMGQLATGLADLSGNRFLLGLGAGHPLINEFALGLPPVPPVQAMSEYLTIVRALLNDGRVDFDGSHYAAHASIESAHGARTPIYLGALRPKMIRLAAERADGLLLWLTPPRYIAEHVIPVVHAACRESGRDPATLSILAMVPVYLPDDHENLYENLEALITQYLMMPSYRHVAEAGGHRERLARGEIGEDIVNDLTVVGDRDEVAARLAEYRAVGCTPIPSATIGVGPLELSGADAVERLLKSVCFG